jgi:hypothetical protein
MGAICQHFAELVVVDDIACDRRVPQRLICIGELEIRKLRFGQSKHVQHQCCCVVGLRTVCRLLDDLKGRFLRSCAFPESGLYLLAR